jgi:transposase
MARPSIARNAFTAADRRRLARALSTDLPARVYRRVAAVVAIADGEDVGTVARRTGVSRATIHRWVARYLDRHDPTSLRDEPRPGRPRRAGVSDRQLRRLLARDPQALGYQSTTWTAALLVSHCAVHFGCRLHPRTLRRRLHALGYRWKRPRYRFLHRAPHLAQKKGLSVAA